MGLIVLLPWSTHHLKLRIRWDPFLVGRNAYKWWTIRGLSEDMFRFRGCSLPRLFACIILLHADYHCTILTRLSAFGLRLRWRRKLHRRCRWLGQFPHLSSSRSKHFKGLDLEYVCIKSLTHFLFLKIKG